MYCHVMMVNRFALGYLLSGTQRGHISSLGYLRLGDGIWSHSRKIIIENKQSGAEAVVFLLFRHFQVVLIY